MGNLQNKAETGPLERKSSARGSLHRVSVIASLRDEDAVISFFHSSASCSHGLGRWSLMFTLLAGEWGESAREGISQDPDKKKQNKTLLSV